MFSLTSVFSGMLAHWGCKYAHALMCTLLTLNARSSQECLGFHGGAPFTANLGDGNGWKEVLCELRQDYSNDLIGSCLETFVGGNHFR